MNTDQNNIGNVAENWGELYDMEQLKRNTVPTAAIVYYNDMYVDTRLSETAAKYINGIKLWVTNEYSHSGLRADGERIFSRLLTMVRNEA